METLLSLDLAEKWAWQFLTCFPAELLSLLLSIPSLYFFILTAFKIVHVEVFFFLFRL